MGLDVAAERQRLQAMLEAPQTPLEEAFKNSILGKGSEPHRWSDETVTSAHYCWRLYSAAWEEFTALAAAPAQAEPSGRKITVIKFSAADGTAFYSANNNYDHIRRTVQRMGNCVQVDALEMTKDEYMAIPASDKAHALAT